MERPVRIQRKRTKGWRMPENTVYVGRGSMWGNPYAILNGDAENAVRKFRSLFEAKPSLLRHRILSIASGRPGFGEAALLEMKLALPELRGKNLACWCPLDQPCHADVLLELANKEASNA